MIYKIEAQGDTVYVKAETQADALARLTEVMGTIPRSLLSISTVSKLPKGEELL